MGNAASSRAVNPSQTTSVKPITTTSTPGPLIVASHPPPTASPFQAPGGPGRGPQIGTRGIIAGTSNFKANSTPGTTSQAPNAVETEDEVAKFVREAIKTTQGPGGASEESAAIKYSKGFDKDKFKMANAGGAPGQTQGFANNPRSPKGDSYDTQDSDPSFGRPKTRASVITAASSGATTSFARVGSGMHSGATGRGNRFLDEDDEDLMEEILAQTDPLADYNPPSNRTDSGMKVQRHQWVAVE